MRSVYSAGGADKTAACTYLRFYQPPLRATHHQTIRVHKHEPTCERITAAFVCVKESNMECSGVAQGGGACSLQHSECLLSRAQHLLAMSCSIDRQWTSYPA